MANGNGNGGGIAGTAKAVINVLPPAFLLLLLLNLAFMGFVVWFLEGQLKARDHMAEALFQRCMEIALKQPPP